VPVIDAPSVVWIAVAILAAVIEVTIPQFGVIFVSLAARSAAIPAWLGSGAITQIAVFVVVLALSLFLLRPRIIAKLSTAPGVPSRTEMLLGREGVVTYDIDPAVGAGRVNVGGQDWAARSATPLATGTRVRVAGADGIVLEVRPT
jgi:membrane protein implicated in regulation of membrane protease activity